MEMIVMTMMVVMVVTDDGDDHNGVNDGDTIDKDCCIVVVAVTMVMS